MNKKGFTLAEVLVTLGVIGIVAAMTLPVVLAKTKKKEYSTKLKKFYSIMHQAIIMSEIDNGKAGEWMKDGGLNGDIKDEEGNPDFKQNSTVISKYVNKYLKPYLKITSINSSDRTVDDGKDYQGEAYIVLADGSYVYLHNGNCIDFIYDTNGPKAPNSDGIDIFRFILCSNEKCSAHTWYTGECGKFAPLGMKPESREDAKHNCKNDPRYCSQLLKIDGFEFKDDYPYKL